MDNRYIDLKNNRERLQQLHSRYIRNIVSSPENNVFFTEISWEEVKFRNSSNNTWMNWNFPKSVILNHALYSIKEEEIKKKLFGDTPFTREKEQYESLYNSFNKLPKTPSVYLLIMQAFDIITFESFISIIHSNNKIFSSIGKFVEIDEISNQESFIGLGLYKDESSFKNGKFYFKYMGYGVCLEKLCFIFQYYCDDSKVKICHEKASKEGKSFYSGHIMIDVENGLCLYGDMEENYVNFDNSIKQEYVRRKITIQLEDENI